MEKTCGVSTGALWTWLLSLTLPWSPFLPFVLEPIYFLRLSSFSYIGNRKEKGYLPSSLSSQGISRSDRGRISFTTCQSPGNGATCSGPSGKESLLLSLAFMLCYSVSTFRSFLAIQTSFFLFFWSKINVGKREVLWFGFLSIALGNLLRSPENNKFPTPWSLSWEEIEPWYLYCWDKLWKGNLGYIALNQLFFFFFLKYKCKLSKTKNDVEEAKGDCLRKVTSHHILLFCRCITGLRWAQWY